MSKKTKKTGKYFQMNDDHADLDDLSILGFSEVDQLIDEQEPAENPLRTQSVQSSEKQMFEERTSSPLHTQMDQVVQGLSGTRRGDQVYLVDLWKLEPYPDQPFQPYPLEQLQTLAEDIRQVGILSPILTRRNGTRLQILAGHNRWAAAKLAGLSEVPVLVLEADDDRAVLVLTSTNLRQREKLLPSEKAFAYKMQMDALKRQGQRGEKTGYNAASFITRQTGDSRMQIHRYIRLTELEPELLELLDRGKISLTPAVAISYLFPECQRQVLAVLQQEGARLSISHAHTLKSMAAASPDGRLQPGDAEKVLLQEKKKREKKDAYIHLRFNRIRAFLPKNVSEEEAEAIIVEALMEYTRAQENR